MRHEVMDYMFKKPSMLDDLDVTFKSDSARKVLFFYQVKHRGVGVVVLCMPLIVRKI